MSSRISIPLLLAAQFCFLLPGIALAQQQSDVPKTDVYICIDVSKGYLDALREKTKGDAGHHRLVSNTVHHLFTALETSGPYVGDVKVVFFAATAEQPFRITLKALKEDTHLRPDVFVQRLASLDMHNTDRKALASILGLEEAPGPPLDLRTTRFDPLAKVLEESVGNAARQTAVIVLTDGEESSGTSQDCMDVLSERGQPRPHPFQKLHPPSGPNTSGFKHLILVTRHSGCVGNQQWDPNDQAREKQQWWTRRDQLCGLAYLDLKPPAAPSKLETDATKAPLSKLDTHATSVLRPLSLPDQLRYPQAQLTEGAIYFPIDWSDFVWLAGLRKARVLEVHTSESSRHYDHDSEKSALSLRPDIELGTLRKLTPKKDQTRVLSEFLGGPGGHYLHVWYQTAPCFGESDDRHTTLALREVPVSPKAYFTLNMDHAVRRNSTLQGTVTLSLVSTTVPRGKHNLRVTPKPQPGNTWDPPDVRFSAKDTPGGVTVVDGAFDVDVDAGAGRLDDVQVLTVGLELSNVPASPPGKILKANLEFERRRYRQHEDAFSYGEERLLWKDREEGDGQYPICVAVLDPLEYVLFKGWWGLFALAGFCVIIISRIRPRWWLALTRWPASVTGAERFAVAMALSAALGRLPYYTDRGRLAFLLFGACVLGWLVCSCADWLIIPNRKWLSALSVVTGLIAVFLCLTGTVFFFIFGRGAYEAYGWIFPWPVKLAWSVSFFLLFCGLAVRSQLSAVFKWRRRTVCAVAVVSLLLCVPLSQSELEKMKWLAHLVWIAIEKLAA
jgi:hypothetical protein